MAASAHPNRSPSPVLSRPCANLNTNSRIPECNFVNRKSFNGNIPFAKPSFLTNPRKYDPTTPANSPSDFGRGRLTEKEGEIVTWANSEEKENDDKDMNRGGTKIPARISKNFMSPTISAASKFTPSPRKKVLVERNDPVRTSISLTDGKAMFFSGLSSDENPEPKPNRKPNSNHDEVVDGSSGLDVAHSEKNEAVLADDPAVSKPLKKVTFSDVPSDSQNVCESFSESVITESDEISVDPKLKKMSSDVIGSIAPLDADPSMPPYDPKTNFLSPRPQFLHYKPNPRIETMLNKHGLDEDEFMPLEDSFTAEITSENLSDSEGTEESATEECRLTDPADLVIGASEMEVPSPVFKTPEQLPVSSTVNSESPENLMQEKEKKRWGFSKLIWSSVFVMLLIAFASLFVIDSPPLDFKDLSFSDLGNVYQQSRASYLAKEKLKSITRNVDLFRIDYISPISKLISRLGEREDIGHFHQFLNLTDSQRMVWYEELLQIKQELAENREENELEEGDSQRMVWNEELLEIRAESVENGEENELEEDEYSESEEGADSDEMFFERKTVGEEDIVETISAELNTEIVENTESENVMHIYTEMEMNIASEDSQFASLDQERTVESEIVELPSETTGSDKQYGETNPVSSTEAAEFASLDQESRVTSGNLELPYETADSEYLHGEADLGSSSSAGAADIISSNQENLWEADDSSSEGASQNSLNLESPVPSQLEEDSFTWKKYLVGIFVLIVALSAATAFIRRKQRRIGSAVSSKKQEPSASVIENTAAPEIISHEKRFSQTIVDLEDESYPSEMSSIQRRSEEEKEKVAAAAAEVESLEKKPRKHSKRESLASSSEYSAGTPSLGSFTTFERIPSKHANREDEVITTPVRRSSRLRNQVASP